MLFCTPQPGLAVCVYRVSVVVCCEGPGDCLSLLTPSPRTPHTLKAFGSLLNDWMETVSRWCVPCGLLTGTGSWKGNFAPFQMFFLFTQPSNIVYLLFLAEYYPQTYPLESTGTKKGLLWKKYIPEIFVFFVLFLLVVSHSLGNLYFFSCPWSNALFLDSSHPESILKTVIFLGLL